MSVSQEILQAIANHFELGQVKEVPTPVYGGLLHKMWHLKTEKGEFAVKALSQSIDFKDKQVLHNYETSEKIAAQFIDQGIPGVCALFHKEPFLFTQEGRYYLVYPWTAAQPLPQADITPAHVSKIGAVLAKMHTLKLSLTGLQAPHFDYHKNDSITEWVEKVPSDFAFFETLKNSLPLLVEANEHYVKAILDLQKYTIISHGDLDPKNVLWDKEQNPILIDWESARRLNPTYEILNAALDWAGITEAFKPAYFDHMIKAYQQAGGVINSTLFKAALYGVIGNWLNWMMYNLKRAITLPDSHQKQMGIEQVTQVLVTIRRVNALASKQTIG